MMKGLRLIERQCVKISFRLAVRAVAPSFNGRTADSGSAYRGSNPWGAAKYFQQLASVALQNLLLVGASLVRFNRLNGGSGSPIAIARKHPKGKAAVNRDQLGRTG